MRPQQRVRKMRAKDRHHERSADGPDQHYYDPAIRAARRAREAAEQHDSEQEDDHERP